MDNRLKNLFGIDPRALAGFRIGLGVLLLVDLGIRVVDLTAHYTDAGVLPRDLLAEYAQRTWRWSIHSLGGSVPFEAGLFCLAGMAALAVLVGLSTRWAVCASWILLVSLHNRNPLVVNGGDVLLRMLLFWSMFLPLGCCWSLDQMLRKRARFRTRGRGDQEQANRPEESVLEERPGQGCEAQPVLSVASAAILLQVTLMYLMSSYFKVQGIWSEPDGFRQLLEVDTYAKSPISWLMQYPALLTWIGFSVLALEIAGPVLVFSPWRTATLRFILVPCFWWMHLGIELSLTVGLFSYVSMLAWVLFLPRMFWDFVVRPQAALQPNARRNMDFDAASADKPASEAVASGHTSNLPWSPWFTGRTTIHHVHPARRAWVSSLANSLAACALVVVILWNLSTLSHGWARTLRCEPMKRVDGLLTIRQKWSMFSRPQRHNGWFVVVARLADGRVVDLLRDGQPADWNSFAKPAAIYRRYTNHRWRKFYRNLAAGSGTRCCGALCRFLAEQWNSSHAPGASVESVELHYMEPLRSPADEQERVMQRILHYEELAASSAK